MTSNNKLAIGIIVFIGVVLIVYFLVKPENTSSNDAKSQIVMVKSSIPRYISLRNFLSDNIQADFFAQYRLKADDFYFFKMVDNKSHSSFELPLDKAAIFDSLVKPLRIRRMWKYSDENYFRFELDYRWHDTTSLNTILILVNDTSYFRVPDGTKLKQKDTTSSEAVFIADKQKKYVLKISRNVWVY